MFNIRGKLWLQKVWTPKMCGERRRESSIHIQVRMSYLRMIRIVLYFIHSYFDAGQG